MSLTTLDPHTALIVVDLQAGVIGLPAVHPIADVVAQARALLDAFRARALPVVLVKVAGGAPGRTEQPRRTGLFTAAALEFIPELNQQPGDLVVVKETWGAFANTGLDAQLKARGVTQVVICGVATGTGVESTARQAYEQGFNVTLAIDAMTDLRAEAHDYSIRNVFPRLGETGTAHDIISLLDTQGA